jgi:hypothetical protein
MKRRKASDIQVKEKYVQTNLPAFAPNAVFYQSKTEPAKVDLKKAETRRPVNFSVVNEVSEKELPKPKVDIKNKVTESKSKIIQVEEDDIIIENMDINMNRAEDVPAGGDDIDINAIIEESRQGVIAAELSENMVGTEFSISEFLTKESIKDVAGDVKCMYRAILASMRLE